MTLKDEYQKLKQKYPKKIILIQSGTFYVTFFQDAEILNYLFSYQIHDDKVGFPIKMKDKILFNLRNEKLNYLVLDKEKREFSFDDNDIFSYEEILKISSQYAKQSSDTQELLDRIKSLIEINPNYYIKIKEFIDEL